MRRVTRSQNPTTPLRAMKSSSDYETHRCLQNTSISTLSRIIIEMMAVFWFRKKSVKFPTIFSHPIVHRWTDRGHVAGSDGWANVWEMVWNAIDFTSFACLFILAYGNISATVVEFPVRVYPLNQLWSWGTAGGIGETRVCHLGNGFVICEYMRPW